MDDLLIKAAELPAADQAALAARLVVQSRQHALAELVAAVREHAPAAKEVRLDWGTLTTTLNAPEGHAHVALIDERAPSAESFEQRYTRVERINENLSPVTVGLVMQLVTGDYDGVYVTVSDEPTVTGGRVYHD